VKGLSRLVAIMLLVLSVNVSAEWVIKSTAVGAEGEWKSPESFLNRIEQLIEDQSEGYNRYENASCSLMYSWPYPPPCPACSNWATVYYSCEYWYYYDHPMWQVDYSMSHRGSVLAYFHEQQEQCRALIVSDDSSAEVEPNGSTLLRAVVECGGSPSAGVELEISLSVEPHSGGHYHHDEMRPSGSISLKGEGGSHTTVRGATESPGLEFQFDAPKVAGNHLISLRCVTKSCLEEEQTKILVGVRGLQKIPDSRYYVLIPNRDQEHPDNHFLTPDSVEKVTRIAQRYHSMFPNDPVLYLNDASLNRGGMFDFSYSSRQQYWRPPHQTHHDGRRIDIRANSLPSAIPARNFREFERIAKEEGCVAEIHNGGTNSQHFHMYCYRS
jgi:hypothetical protein